MNAPSKHPITHMVVVDRLPSPIKSVPGRLIIKAKDYINNDVPYTQIGGRGVRIINLCQNYGYLKVGYYCSLLADARGHRCLPDMADIAHMNWKRIYRHALVDLDEALNRHPLPPDAIPDEEVYVFFGRTQNEYLQRFARRVFDAFRLPAVKVVISRSGGKKWKIDDVAPVQIGDLGDLQDFFNEALGQFTGTYWERRSKKTVEEDKYWLAVLHDPEERLPPSNERALKKLVTVGRRMGFYVELITRGDIDSLLEFDALFIRETTAVNNHTYRFAMKAESEGIPSIDDTTSMLRCCNKVYLQELLRNKRIKTPEGYFIYRRQSEIQTPSPDQYPLVLKVPDGSFSLGVYRVFDAEEFHSRLQDLFRKTELVLVQEFVKSEYDWRIVILGGKPLVACKYYMAQGHWQIYNHAAKRYKEGPDECVPIEKVPKRVLSLALKAAALIGDGLYGVDLKETKKGVYVIEINDNPNLDAGVEDKCLGDGLYEAIISHFKQMIDG